MGTVHRSEKHGFPRFNKPPSTESCVLQRKHRETQRDIEYGGNLLNRLILSTSSLLFKGTRGTKFPTIAFNEHTCRKSFLSFTHPRLCHLIATPFSRLSGANNGRFASFNLTRTLAPHSLNNNIDNRFPSWLANSYPCDAAHHQSTFSKRRGENQESPQDDQLYL